MEKATESTREGYAYTRIDEIDYDLPALTTMSSTRYVRITYKPFIYLPFYSFLFFVTDSRAAE